MTRRPYRPPRLVRYQPPRNRIEEYMVATGTNIAKCNDPGTCSGGRGTGLPEWIRNDFGP